MAPGCPGVGTPPPSPLRHFLRTLLVGVAAALCAANVQQAQAQRVHKETFTHADTLRGSITPERAWWDVTFYDLHVAISLADSTIRGYNGITYRVVQPPREMQIDLQQPLDVDSMVQDGQQLTYRRDGNAFFVTMVIEPQRGRQRTNTVARLLSRAAARRASTRPGTAASSGPGQPGHPWIATADEGLGASVWWPNKDTQADEPDSQRIAITVPDPMHGRVQRAAARHRRTTAMARRRTSGSSTTRSTTTTSR